MTLTRARVLRRDDARAVTLVVATEALSASGARGRLGELARVPRLVVAAEERALALVAEGERKAAALVRSAEEAVAAQRQQVETELVELREATHAANRLALAAERARGRDSQLDELTRLSGALAERLIGRALELDPAVVLGLARTVVAEATGSDRLSVRAHESDVLALRALIDERVLEIVIDESLARGSIVVESRAGVVDGRLPARLAALAPIVRAYLDETARAGSGRP